MLSIQVLTIWIALLSCGMSNSFPAIAIPALQNSGANLPPTLVSVVGSSRQIGTIFGALIIGPLLDNWGRRKGFLISILPGIAGYLTIASHESLIALCIGLILEGFAFGMINSSASVYLAEILSIEWRGAISVSRNMMNSGGVTLTFILGLVLMGHIRLIALVDVFFPAIAFILGLCIIKETEVWSEQAKSPNRVKKSFAASYKDFFVGLTTRPELYKPYLILNFVTFLRQSAGEGVIAVYAINIIADSGASLDPYIVAIIMGSFRTLSGLGNMLLCKVFGRRRMMITSSIIMVLTMIPLCASQFTSGWPKYTPEILIVLYMSNSFIFHAISVSLHGEMYPTEFRGIGSSSSMTISNLIGGFVLFLYPLLRSWMGSDYIMIIFAIAALGCILATILLIPDTDNKSLEEIGRIFRNKNEVPTGRDEVLPLKAGERPKIQVDQRPS